MDAKKRREPSKVWGMAFLVIVALALVPYFSLAMHAQSLVMDLVGLAAGALMFVGIAVSRPEPAVAWIMIGLGSLTMTGGDIVYGTSQPVPSPADMLYVTAYALLALGLLALARSETRSPAESSLTDVVIVAIGVAIAGILFLVVPAEHGNGVGFGARAVSIGYPLIDLALIAVLIRPILREEGRRMVFLFLGAGLVLRLLGDLGYAMQNFGTAYQAGNRADAFWMLSYACFAGALLHPALGRSGEWSSLRAGEALPEAPEPHAPPMPNAQVQALRLRTILVWAGIALLALGAGAMYLAHSWQAPEIVLLAGTYAATGSLVLVASAVNV